VQKSAPSRKGRPDMAEPIAGLQSRLARAFSGPVDVASRPSHKPYILIAGHGRSGSNRVLDVLDCHPVTFCRNEPNEITGNSLLFSLPDGFFPDTLPTGFPALWDAARAEAMTRLSERDRFDRAPKLWTQKGPQHDLIGAILKRRRARQLAGIVRPDLAHADYSMPPGFADPVKLHRDALQVMKILLMPAWTIAAHDHDRGTRIIHNIRQPEAFLRSWYTRYVSTRDPESVYADNLPYLTRILPVFDQKPRRNISYSAEKLFESELWRWRYVNESLFNALSGSKRYLISPYEAFDHDPDDAALAIFSFAGLVADDQTLARVRRLKNIFSTHGKSGKTSPSLPVTQRFLTRLIETVLEGSPLLELDETKVMSPPRQRAMSAPAMRRENPQTLPTGDRDRPPARKKTAQA